MRTAALEGRSFHEHAHRTIMELYQKQGRPERAIEQFERYRRVLREQLNVEPSPELVLMRTRIRSGRRHSSSTEPRTPDALRAEWNRALASDRWHELADPMDAVTESFDIRGRFE